jgi:heterotetrameric sarcosine oxidase gamma subunit
MPPAPLHALEVWSNPIAVSARLEAALSFPLPGNSHSGGSEDLRLIRFEPTVWLVEGDVTALSGLLGDDGALTAIGGGVIKLRLSGPGWRRLLMERGVFDAESPGFAPGCSAATVIDHVNVRLHVVDGNSCDVWVPASFAREMIHFWEAAARALD